MRCPSCSAEMPEASRFCGGCGAPLALDDTPTRTSIETPAQAGTRLAGAPPAPGTAQPRARSPRVSLSSSLPDSRFLPGAILADRYRIVGLLGKGGMGEVYRADDLKLGQPVALKFLPEELAADEERLARFFGEVRTARQVTHPNVCRVYDLGEVDGHHYISMEYVDGEDLGSLLKRIGHLPRDKAIQVARQICAGVAAAHERGILHRDLKPANIMIDGEGRARITDFGLAGLAEELRRQQEIAGTPAFMAPEQLDGRGASVRSDLYALGLVLYQLFTGKPAFAADSIAAMAELQRSASPTSPSNIIEGFDPAVERIILKCIEKDPALRPASALSIAAALPGGDPLAAALAAGETPSPELVAASGESEAMHPVLALGLALLVVTLFAASARLNGAHTLRAWAPLDKPPAVQVDRAREIIRQLGYTEEIFSNPVDTATGYSVWGSRIDWIEEHDRSPDRWEQLRQARPGAASFWYRQRPMPLIPEGEGASFVNAPVGRWDPFPSVTGEILVSLDAAGRLELFAYRPRHYFEGPESAVQPDWAQLFDLAGFDPARFETVEPRYQRFVAPQHRAAWIGRLPERPDEKIRIEAGTLDGRVILFAVLDASELRNVSAGPRIDAGESTLSTVTMSMIILLLIAGGILARWNIRRGRADRRGAVRLATFVFVLTAIWQALRLNTLFAPIAITMHFFPILGTGLLYGAVLWVWYIGLEPYARRIWPTMLVSWSRLLSTAGSRRRDPLLGRSILAGMLASCIYWLILALRPMVAAALDGVPLRPDIGDWTVILNQRFALSAIAGGVINGLTDGLVLAFVLVGGRLLARRQWLAVAIAYLLWSVLGLRTLPAEARIGFELIFLFIGAAITIVLLLRFGLVAVMVSTTLRKLYEIAATPDWTAWHSQPALLCLAFVAALAAYGCWAASAGRSFVSDSEMFAAAGAGRSV